MNLPNLKLVSFTLCPFVQRALITLLEKDVPHEIEYIDLSNPPQWFHEISPLEKVPVLVVDGNPLFESMAICEFLDEITPGSLYPEDPFLKAQNRAWIEFGNDILGLTYGLYATNDETTYKQNIAKLNDRFETLEDYLGDGPYFNGEKFSLVDAVYGPVFRYHEGISKYKDFGFFNETPKVANWSKTLLARPSVQKCVPETYQKDLDDYLQKVDSVFANNFVKK
jgi:glutathione S-transferase